MVKEASLAKAAELARLKLNHEELEQFSREAEDILKLFSQIDKVDTKGVEPAFQPIELKNAYRKDVVQKSLSQKEALAGSRHTEAGYFKGPKTL